MQIEETNEDIRAAEAKKQEENGFTFVTVPAHIPSVFPNFKTKDTLVKFTQWGITDEY